MAIIASGGVGPQAGLPEHMVLLTGLNIASGDTGQASWSDAVLGCALRSDRATVCAL